MKTFVAKDLKDWRNWLEKNHLKEDRIILVKYKKHTGKPIISNHDSMREAICFGWIDTTARRIDEDKYAESRSVLLMKSIKSIDDYLNLSPLVIDTNSETIDTKDKFDIKKDIFLYTKFRGDHLMYLGTEVTEKCDLRTLSNYDTLVQEFKQMSETISG